MILPLFALLVSSPATSNAQVSATPFGAEGEKAALVGAFEERSGSWNGVTYSYLLSLEGDVVNGSINGPINDTGLSMDDPDRWVIRVDRDKVTDAVRWYAHHYATGLMLALNRLGHITAVCIVDSTYPGRVALVRVGSNRALSVPNNCSSGAAAPLEAQLLKGGNLVVRRYEWPYDFPQDKEGKADNFDKLIKLFKFLSSYKRR